MGSSLELKYVISEKASFVVVSLTGSVSRTTLEIFERCAEELTAKEGIYYVVNLIDVFDMDLLAIPRLVRLQKTIRDKGGFLQVCLTEGLVRNMMIEKGAVREAEVAANVPQALQRLQSISRGGTPAMATKQL